MAAARPPWGAVFLQKRQSLSVDVKNIASETEIRVHRIVNAPFVPFWLLRAAASGMMDISARARRANQGRGAPGVELSFRARVSRTAGAYAALLLATQVGAVLCAALLRAVWPQLVQSGWGVWLVTDIPLYGVAAPAALAWLRRAVPAGPRPARGPMRPWRAVPWLVCVLGLAYLANFVTLLVAPAAQQSGQVASLALGGSMWANALFGCVVAPLGEEWLFRKTLHGAVGLYGEKVYVALSALMFALFHCNMAQFLYTLCVGAALAALYVRTGRLWAAVLAHMAVNATGFLAAPLAMQNATAALCFSGLAFFCMFTGALWLVFRLKGFWQGLRPGLRSVLHPVHEALRARGLVLYAALCIAFALAAAWQGA